MLFFTSNQQQNNIVSFSIFTNCLDIKVKVFRVSMFYLKLNFDWEHVDWVFIIKHCWFQVNLWNLYKKFCSKKDVVLSVFNRKQNTLEKPKFLRWVHHCGLGWQWGCVAGELSLNQFIIAWSVEDQYVSPSTSKKTTC